MSIYEVVSPLGRRAEQRKEQLKRPRTLDGVTIGELSITSSTANSRSESRAGAAQALSDNQVRFPHRIRRHLWVARIRSDPDLAREARTARVRSRHLRQRRVRELHRREFAGKHSSRKRRASRPSRSRSMKVSRSPRRRSATGGRRPARGDLSGRHIHARAGSKIVKNIEDVLVDQIVRHLTDEGPRQTRQRVIRSRKIGRCFQRHVRGGQRRLLPNQWSDGLPIVPPRSRRSKRSCASPTATRRSAGRLHPSQAQATVWNIAVNGVMAGCRPEYMPSWSRSSKSWPTRSMV